MFNRPFYLMRKDALEEASVSSRQETHWKAAELFRPELADPETKQDRRYTERDVLVLRWLRKFLDERDGLGLSIAALQKLMLRTWEARQSQFRLRGPDIAVSAADLTRRYVDSDELVLKSAEQVVYDAFKEIASRESINDLEQWAYRIVTLYLFRVSNDAEVPELFWKKRNDLVARIKGDLGEVARANVDADPDGEPLWSIRHFSKDHDRPAQEWWHGPDGEIHTWEDYIRSLLRRRHGILSPMVDDPAAEWVDVEYHDALAAADDTR